jgi:hypothetical protein
MVYQLVAAECRDPILLSCYQVRQSAALATPDLRLLVTAAVRRAEVRADIRNIIGWSKSCR